MSQLQGLIDAIIEEDRLLRQRLANLGRKFRELPGHDGTLSFKETLGHVSFWDDYTVQFFSARLDQASCDQTPPDDFETRSAAALEATRKLPFGEVLARYLEATGAMIDFLRENWSKLNESERSNFWIPLKHRRQHRVALFEALDRLEAEDRSNSLASEA